MKDLLEDNLTISEIEQLLKEKETALDNVYGELSPLRKALFDDKQRDAFFYVPKQYGGHYEELSSEERKLYSEYQVLKQEKDTILDEIEDLQNELEELKDLEQDRITDSNVDSFVKRYVLAKSTEEILDIAKLKPTTKFNIGPMFILPSGELIDVTEYVAKVGYSEDEATHDGVGIIICDEIFKHDLGENVNIDYGSSGKLLKYLTEIKGWIRVNSGSNSVENRCYCVIPSYYGERPKSAQYYALLDWFDFCQKIHKPSVSVMTEEHENNEYSFGDYTSDEILGKIKRYYSSGNLYESVEKPNDKESSLKEIDDVFGQEDVYMWSTYVLPNGHFLSPDTENAKEYWKASGNEPEYEHSDFIDYGDNRWYGEELFDECIKLNVTYPYIYLPKSRLTLAQQKALKEIIRHKSQFTYSISDIEDRIGELPNVKEPLMILSDFGETAIDLADADEYDVLKFINKAYMTNSFDSHTLGENHKKDLGDKGSNSYSNKLTESLGHLPSGYITDSPYDILNLITNKPKEYRILYDANIDKYMIGDAWETTHLDLLEEAIRDGYYSNNKRVWEILDAIVYLDGHTTRDLVLSIPNYFETGTSGEYDIEPNIDPYLVIMFYSPTEKDDGAALADGYQTPYKGKTGTIYTRDSDLEDCDLHRLWTRK